MPIHAFADSAAPRALDCAPSGRHLISAFDVNQHLLGDTVQHRAGTPMSLAFAG
jgi:hypothetical protein